MPSLSNGPQFPKSLYLVQPLFSSYELNAVAASAQAFVPVPDGLDLDSWIVPPPREAAQSSSPPVREKKKKVKKGKGKDVLLSGSEGRLPQNGERIPPVSVESDGESLEEKALREKVMFSRFDSNCDILNLTPSSEKQNGWRNYEMILITLKIPSQKQMTWIPSLLYSLRACHLFLTVSSGQGNTHDFVILTALQILRKINCRCSERRRTCFLSPLKPLL